METKKVKDFNELGDEEKKNVLETLKTLPNPDDIQDFRILILSADTHWLEWKPLGGSWTPILNQAGAEVNIKGATGATGATGAASTVQGPAGPQGIRGPRGWRGDGSATSGAVVMTDVADIAARDAIAAPANGDFAYVLDTGDGTDGVYIYTTYGWKSAWAEAGTITETIGYLQVTLAMTVSTSRTIDLDALPDANFDEQGTFPPLLTIGVDSAEFEGTGVGILINDVYLNKTTEVNWVTNRSFVLIDDGLQLFPGDVIKIIKSNA